MSTPVRSRQQQTPAPGASFTLIFHNARRVYGQARFRMLLTTGN